MSEFDTSQGKLLGALTPTARKHLGEDTLVIDEEDNPDAGWRIARGR